MFTYHYVMVFISYSYIVTFCTYSIDTVNIIPHDVWRLLILSNEEKTNDYENFEKGMIYMKIWKRGESREKGGGGNEIHAPSACAIHMWPEYPEKSTDLPQVTDKLFSTGTYVFCGNSRIIKGGNKFDRWRYDFPLNRCFYLLKS
jgi:hypothetical protein